MAVRVTSADRSLKTFETSGGGRIFRISLEAFPDFWAYAYLVLVDDYKVLIDTGSNFHNSNQNLDEGFKAIGDLLGEPISYSDLTHIFITHGHIDHFGGLAYLNPLIEAKVGVHSLDRRNLTNYEERLVVVAKRLDNYLLESGVNGKRAQEMHDMYMLSKSLFHSVDVDFTYEDVGMQVGPFEMLHVPGHCAGMVLIRLHDVIFSGDHVLNGISPHQAPESLTLNTGLGHYLDSLKTAEEWAGDVRLTLGGHKTPIDDLGARIGEIRQEHEERLQKVLKILEKPDTIAGVSKQLFGKVDGYNVLLAVEEAGAHVEYLYQRGWLEINNLPEVQKTGGIVPVEYRRLDGEVDGAQLIA